MRVVSRTPPRTSDVASTSDDDIRFLTDVLTSNHVFRSLNDHDLQTLTNAFLHTAAWKIGIRDVERDTARIGHGAREFVRNTNAKKNQKLPSPRGVPDRFDADAASPAASAHRPPSSSDGDSCDGSLNAAVLGPFPNEETSARAINDCAARLLEAVLTRTIALVGHFCRMTIRSRDVAMALESFAKADGDDPCYRLFPSGEVAAENAREHCRKDEDADDEWREGDDDASVGKGDPVDQAMMDECMIADEEIVDSSDDEEDEYAVGTLHSSSAPAFDAVYPPVADVEQLTYYEFRKHLLSPDLEQRRYSVSYAIGDDALVTNNDTRAGIMEPGIENCHVIAMLKKVMFAFLMTKLSIP